MKFNDLKISVCTICGTAGALIADLFGGWSTDLATLIILMVIDYIMGIIVAGVFKKSSKSDTGALNSNAGWKGLCKKGVMILIVLVAYRLDVSVGTSYIKSVAIIGFIANETISIFENAGIMGVPIPDKLKNVIDLLKSKNGDDDETD